MRPTTPTASANADLGPLLQRTHPSSPPYTPTTPKSPFHPSPSSPETPSVSQRRRAQYFSRPLASQPRGSENRYAPLMWQRLGGDNEEGGYIQPLGPGTNKFSYVPGSRGRTDDPSLSPRSSSPEPSEDDDDDDASSVSPRSLTDDDEFVEKERSSNPGFKTKKLGKGIEGSLVDEDEDMEARVGKGNSHDRGRRRRSTIKANTNFILEEMPSRSQERDPENMLNSDFESLIIVHPDRYSDADTAPSRDRSLDIHTDKNIPNPAFHGDKSKYETASFPVAANGTIETDTTDTDANPSLDPKIMESMLSLNCESDEDREAWLKRKHQEKRQKRWSLGSQKRSITQSIGSGTDEEDLHGDGNSVVAGGGDEGGVAVGGSARRLRRRTGVGGERPVLKRVSLLFEDPPRRIEEVEEPESDFGGAGVGAYRVGLSTSGVEVGVMDDELPYFLVGGEDDIDMDE